MAIICIYIYVYVYVKKCFLNLFCIGQCSRLSAIKLHCAPTGGPDVVLAFHDVVWLSSATPVVLTSAQSVAAGCETNPLIRAHGMDGEYTMHAY